MARIFPDVDPSQLEHTSEEPVYKALRDELPDEYIVIHSYPWLRPWRGENALSEGEADFVLLHPEKGLLVLEVKGGDDIRYDGKLWFRGGDNEFKDPFNQARRNMHALLDIAEERSGKRIRRKQLVHGYAVVFPHLDYEDQPPPHAEKAIILSRRHLLNMDQAIEAAYAKWTDKPLVLDRDRFQMLVTDCLMPQFRLFRPVGPDINIVSEKLMELTELQAQVFTGLYAQNRVLVEGVAGSGKTILALQRALSFARSGKRTLFVCYNRELAIWIRRQIDEDPTTEDFRGLVTVNNFHALAAELAAEAKLSFKPMHGGNADEAFWNDEVPDLLEQAVLIIESTSSEVRYDALVVDEAQDFSLGWWYALTQSLLKSSDAPIYSFMDPNQSLRGEVQKPDIEFDTTFQLTMNCRNTRKIAAASAAILDLDSNIFAQAPSGVHLRLLRAGTERHQKGLVLEELRRLLGREDVSPSQITLIGVCGGAKLVHGSGGIWLAAGGVKLCHL